MLDDRFSSGSGEWLGPNGPDNDVVISTRIRLARNIRGHKMPWRSNQCERQEVEAKLKSGIADSQIIPEGAYWSIDDLSETERRLLVERHLISPELAKGRGSRGVIFAPTENLSIMTNEEDHLRIQGIHRGLQLEETWRVTNQIDSVLESRLPFAVSSRWGYLTACPTNVGTGLRVSVMLHLPVLVHTDQIKKVHTAASRVGLVVRGLYGEGTKASGDFYQISNQVTLGRDEVQILRDVRTMVLKIIEWERGLRKLVMQQDRVTMEDRAWRALGTLQYARKMNSEETMQHLSSVRLGINLEILHDLGQERINDLFLYTQPAHLQVLRGAPSDPEERDISRARLIREWLA